MAREFDFIDKAKRRSYACKKQKSPRWLRRIIWTLFLIAGFLLLGVLGSNKSKRETKSDFIHVREGNLLYKVKSSDAIPIYSAIEETICATSPSFLDSSPLLSPANFASVSPDLELVVSGFGGFSRRYWELTPDGQNKIYVYLDMLDQKFRLVRYKRKN